MSPLLNAILLWFVVALLVTLIVYSVVKIFLIAFRYRKEVKQNEEKIKRLIEKKG